MLNVDVVSIEQVYGYIKLSWNHALHGEHPLHVDSRYYLYRLDNNDIPRLFGQLDPKLTNFQFSISPQERGETIKLGIALYDGKTHLVGNISLFSPVYTIPNPPELIIVKQAADNIVKLEWLAPDYRANVRGYLVERSTDQMHFEPIAVASCPFYSDIGQRYGVPRNGARYYYRISSVTYSGIKSSSIHVGVNVVQKKHISVPTLAQKQIASLPPGSYRLKGVGVEEIGATQWIKIHNIVADARQDLPEIPQMRIRAITSEGDTSLIIKTRNLAVPLAPGYVINDEEDYINDDADNRLLSGVYQSAKDLIFRIRAVAVDGTESHALLSTLVHRIRSHAFIVNKSTDFVADLNQNKMVNKGG